MKRERAPMLEHSFYFAHREMFVVPIEHLGPSGMSAEYRRTLEAEGRVEPDWARHFDEAFATYFQRIGEIARRAPATWLPPRLQNVCVVTDAELTRPYYQPFDGSSWYLYASDFDPATSHRELATYLMVFQERLAIARQVAHAVIHTAGYLLTLGDPELGQLVDACRRTVRPDRDAFRALAGAMPALRATYHDDLRPAGALSEPTRRIEPAGLTVVASAGADLQGLALRFNQVGRDVAERYFSRQRAERPGADVDRVVTFLAESRPNVLLTDETGRTLWDPERPQETDRARDALASIAGLPAEGLCNDLAVVADRSDRFLRSLREPDRLGKSDELDQAGGTYIHEDRHIIVYSLLQPGLKPLLEAAPPYHRMLLAARVVHEWGHLAADAGWVRVPDHKHAAFAELERDLQRSFHAAIAEAPAEVGAIGRREVELLASEGFSLSDITLKRKGDYQANLLARRYLESVELEAYVRANVKSHHQEGIGPYLLLARYAYELQYLRLTSMSDPLGYFLASTWFVEHFIDRGVVGRDRAIEIFDTVASLYGCLEIDETAFWPASGSRD